MKTVFFALAVVAALVGPVRAGSAQPLSTGIDQDDDNQVSLQSSRASWPLVREPSGNWGVVGEGVARSSGAETLTIRSVSFSIWSREGRLLFDQLFDAPESIASVLFVSSQTVGAPAWKPAGTVQMAPGDVAVVYLAALTDPTAIPSRARVTMRFDRARPASFTVPLDAFDTGQHMGWPLRTDGKPCVAINTPGTPGHWIGSTVFAKRGLFSSQRFALDLVQVDDDGQTHLPAGDGKASYYAWNEEVLSVGRGQVVAVVSDAPDHEIGDPPSPTEHPAGNFIVIQHAPRLFSVYAHMQRGTAAVRVGDWVERGWFIGRVGNSGDTTEPHLHVHFTDAWRSAATAMETYTLSQGVPAMFWDVRVFRNGAFFPMNGSTPLEMDVIVR